MAYKSVHRLDRRSGNTPLLDACEYGDHQLAACYLNVGADANAANHDGRMALHLACRYALMAAVVVSTLTTLTTMAYKSVHRLDRRSGNTPLLNACEYGDRQLAACYLNAGADVGAANHEERTALHLACRHWKRAWIRAETNRSAYHVVTAGASAQQQKHSNETSIVDLLIKHGAYVNTADDNGVTPLHMACGYDGNSPCLSVVKMLVENKADVNRTESDGRTSLHIICDNPADCLDVVRLLVDRGIDCNAADGQGRTPLHEACQHGHLSYVQLIVDVGADMDTADVVWNDLQIS